ncbi:hypothetical protein AABD40_08885 [Staphylococcus shinii]|nr:hypothetical protein [Staphylococcus shinii]MDW8572891.1 hypothetical protein [Staphylococcus shinii]
MNKELDEYLKNMIPESPEDELIKMIYFFRKFHLRGITQNQIWSK